MSCVTYFCGGAKCSMFFKKRPSVCPKCGSTDFLHEWDEQDDHHPEPPEPDYDDGEEE